MSIKILRGWNIFLVNATKFVWSWGVIVYCFECRTKNEEVTEPCVKCGAKLNVSKMKSGYS